MTHDTTEAGAPADNAVRRLVGELERYAGWLGKDAQSARLRTSVRGLARAVDNGDDPLSTFRMVQAHLSRLSAGGVTPLLRRTMRNLRAEIGVPSL